MTAATPGGGSPCIDDASLFGRVPRRRATTSAWLLDLPWHGREASRPINLKQGAAASSTGITTASTTSRTRILEFLAVRRLTKGEGREPGPLLRRDRPGVGKTSLGRSIAEAMGRRVRARLRGRDARRGRNQGPSSHLRRRHARARSSRRSSVSDRGGLPCSSLDEIDKMGSRTHGAILRAAMLEVLDPEQNNDVPRPLPRCAVRPLAGVLPLHLQRAREHPRSAARSHGGRPGCRATRAGEKLRDRAQATWCRSVIKDNGLTKRQTARLLR